MKVIVLALTIGLMRPPLAAQSGAIQVYVDQFWNLQQKINDVFAQVSRSEVKRYANQEEVLSTAERLSALENLTFQLHDSIGKANLALFKSQQIHDKRLFLAAQGCVAIHFVIEALTSFIYTGDHAFLGLAKDGQDMMASVSKML